MLIQAWRSTWLRFSGVVDVPNSCATLYLPTAVFEFEAGRSTLRHIELVDRSLLAVCGGKGTGRA